jgi:hypothetical protein
MSDKTQTESTMHQSSYSPFRTRNGNFFTETEDDDYDYDDDDDLYQMLDGADYATGQVNDQENEFDRMLDGADYRRNNQAIFSTADTMDDMGDQFAIIDVDGPVDATLIDDFRKFAATRNGRSKSSNNSSNSSSNRARQSRVPNNGPRTGPNKATRSRSPATRSPATRSPATRPQPRRRPANLQLAHLPTSPRPTNPHSSKKPRSPRTPEQIQKQTQKQRERRAAAQLAKMGLNHVGPASRYDEGFSARGNDAWYSVVAPKKTSRGGALINHNKYWRKCNSRAQTKLYDWSTTSGPNLCESKHKPRPRRPSRP